MGSALEAISCSSRSTLAFTRARTALAASRSNGCLGASPSTMRPAAMGRSPPLLGSVGCSLEITSPLLEKFAGSPPVAFKDNRLRQRGTLALTLTESASFLPPMLPFFPMPERDELLYSLIARYHRLSCDTSPKATLQALFGRRNVRANVDLPGHLEALTARLPPAMGLTSRDLAQRHTLLPYHVALQPRAAAIAALRAMVSGSTTGLHLRLGLGGAAHRPQGLRSCLACWEEVRGERYWHRCHQLPGVLICAVHRRPLATTSLQRLRIGQHRFLAAEDVPIVEAITPDWSRDISCLSLLHRIAQESLAYLSHPLGAEAPADPMTARDLCVNRRLMRSGHQVDLARLVEAQQRALQPLCGVFPEADDPRWLAALVRHHRSAVRPLHAILFRIIVEATEATPRSRLKPAARRFLAEDPVFEERLRITMAQSPGLRAAARALGVDTRTVRRHVARLGLPAPWAAAPEERPVRCPEPPSAYGRWRTVAHANPAAGKAALRRLAPAAFAWLYRHDRDWLRDHSPARQARRPRSRTDWSAIDSDLCARVDAATRAIRTRTPPERVTFVALERVLARAGWIADRKAKLPLSVSHMARALETTHDFQIRRLAWVRAEVAREQSTAPEWRVRRRAGVPLAATIPSDTGQPHG